MSVLACADRLLKLSEGDPDLERAKSRILMTIQLARRHRSSLLGGCAIALLLFANGCAFYSDSGERPLQMYVQPPVERTQIADSPERTWDESGIKIVADSGSSDASDGIRISPNRSTDADPIEDAAEDRAPIQWSTVKEVALSSDRGLMDVDESSYYDEESSLGISGTSRSQMQMATWEHNIVERSTVEADDRSPIRPVRAFPVRQAIAEESVGQASTEDANQNSSRRSLGTGN